MPEILHERPLASEWESLVGNNASYNLARNISYLDIASNSLAECIVGVTDNLKFICFFDSLSLNACQRFFLS